MNYSRLLALVALVILSVIVVPITLRVRRTIRELRQDEVERLESVENDPILIVTGHSLALAREALLLMEGRTLVIVSVTLTVDAFLGLLGLVLLRWPEFPWVSFGALQCAILVFLVAMWRPVPPEARIYAKFPALPRVSRVKNALALFRRAQEQVLQRMPEVWLALLYEGLRAGRTPSGRAHCVEAVATLLACEEDRAKQDVDRRVEEMAGALRRLLLILLATLLAVFVSLSWTQLSQLNEAETLLDAAYFAVATISTVGFGDVHPSGVVMKAVTLVVMCDLLMLVFGAVNFFSSIIESRIRHGFSAYLEQHRRLAREAALLRYLAASGRLGQHVDYLLARHEQVSVVKSHLELLRHELDGDVT